VATMAAAPGGRGDHFPNLLVLVGRAERRHAGHPDAVLRNPEQLAARPARYDVRQIGWLGIESLADVGRVLAWRAVAIDARLVVEAEPFPDLLLARLMRPRFIPRGRIISRVQSSLPDCLRLKTSLLPDCSSHPAPANTSLSLRRRLRVRPARVCLLSAGGRNLAMFTANSSGPLQVIPSSILPSHPAEAASAMA